MLETLLLLFVLAAALLIGYFAMRLVDKGVEEIASAAPDSTTSPLTSDCDHHIHRENAS